MRWPWSSREPPDSNSGEEAKVRSQEELNAAQEQWATVRDVTDALREHRSRNHFGAAVEASMRRRWPQS